MKKNLVGALTALSVLGTAFTGMPASAQTRQQRQEWRQRQEWQQRHNRQDRRQDRRQARNWQYYGGSYGYNGYNGQWRTGQRYPHYNRSSYYLNDYRSYGLPAPRAGYRYYRESNGDVVLAAIAGGAIGLILGGALNGNHRRY